MNTDYVICFRRGGGKYTMLDLGSMVKAAGHKRALELFLRKLGGVCVRQDCNRVRGSRYTHEGRCGGVPEGHRNGVKGVF